MSDSGVSSESDEPAIADVITPRLRDRLTFEAPLEPAHLDVREMFDKLQRRPVGRHDADDQRVQGQCAHLLDDALAKVVEVQQEDLFARKGRSGRRGKGHVPTLSPGHESILGRRPTSRRVVTSASWTNPRTDGTTRSREHRTTTATPPVMWPDEGSGFEADPFSPAGMSQQIWTATRRRPRSRAGMWTLRIVCVVIALAFIAAQVVH